VLMGLGRTALTQAENRRLLAGSRREALTDGLTGLGNRRALTEDLVLACQRATSDRPCTLAFFDLDGFKSYNDTFGHSAGDALLPRLGRRLAGAVGDARAYRVGGDEFCLLIGGSDEIETIVDAGATALSERGEGFVISASRGVVAIPADAATPTDVLRLADERMYAHKNARRGSTRGQAGDVLMALLSESEPAVHRHTSEVMRLARALGRHFGLRTQQLDVLTRAAELHDIGKVAIPAEVLHKSGPLDEEEWELVRQHTLIGERILSVATDMRPVARIVRSTHERWDGAGYPDGLRGDEIAQEARIIAVCDAYETMIAHRSYRSARSSAEALAELERCAGTQFDPAVVAAFRRTLAAERPREVAYA
jgi:two-component system, cell cycle response regulator